jgi:prepilin-type N-terminal cleavage/methylation domain-containing protein/prepilin-type processing-associated H-X9-DG protein
VQPPLFVLSDDAMNPNVRRRADARLAFTLVELLVVIAIIGALVALLLPAVQAARESARQSTCANNMRQVSLALLLHHEAKGVFPHGTYNVITDDVSTPAPYNGRQNRRCWMHDMLPYMEQHALYQRFDNFMKTHTQAYDFPECHTVIEALMCPSDPANPKVVTYSNSTPGVSGPPPSYDGLGASQGFHGNFITCSGERHFNPSGPGLKPPFSSMDLAGIFFAVSKISMKHITDGASKTALVSELILSPEASDDDVRGRYYNPIEGNVNFTTLYPPNTPTADRINWLSKDAVTEAPAFPCTACFVSDAYLSARSYHPGGVNFAAADGSIHFMPNDVDFLVYRGFGTRAGSSTRFDQTNELGEMP